MAQEKKIQIAYQVKTTVLQSKLIYSKSYRLEVVFPIIESLKYRKVDI